MKKNALLLLIIAFLSSCAVTYIDPAVENSGLTKKEKDFIIDFENIVLKNKKRDFIQLLEPSYKKEQFEEMYHGDVNNFVSDFFCGKSGDKFKCIPMGRIDKIELLEYSKNGDMLFLKFKVYSGNKFIIVDDLQIKKYRDKDGKVKLGLIGAYG